MNDSLEVEGLHPAWWRRRTCRWLGGPPEGALAHDLKRARPENLLPRPSPKDCGRGQWEKCFANLARRQGRTPHLRSRGPSGS